MDQEIPYFTTDLITLEDVSRAYPTRELLNPHPAIFSGAVLAFGRAVYETVPRRAVDALFKLGIDLARDFAPGNLWALPTYGRLTYPYAVYWPLACAFEYEREQGRRFDYFLWADDDVLFDISDVIAMTKAMKAHDAPFMAAVPYDRMRPHSPAIVEKLDGQPYKWVKAPPSGSYPVCMTGFNLCLFRRDIFEKVPEPWFGVCAPAKGFSGIAPDWWWSVQMEKAGIQPWVCCDTNVIHLAEGVDACRATSETYFASHDVTDLGILSDKTLHTSPNTGAIMTVPPTFPDGRGEYTQGTNL